MTTWESPWQRRISNCWNSSCCPRECCATHERATAAAPSPAMRVVRRRQQRQTDELCELCSVAASSTAAGAAAPTLAIRELLCCRSPTKRPLGSSTLQSAGVWQDGAAHAGDHDGGNKRVMINENNSSDSELLKSSVVPL